MPDKNTGNVRFYMEELPKLGDCVIVVVGKTTELGVHVKLLEYGRIDGLVVDGLANESRSDSFIARRGKKDVVKVIGIDTRKGLIKLSKRQITKTEHDKSERKFHEAKTADAILRFVSFKTFDSCPPHIGVAQLYKDIGWPLTLREGSLWRAFVMSKIDKNVWLGIRFPRPEVYALLNKYIARRLNPFKIRTELRIECHGYKGIEAIKDALRAGRACATAAVPIDICLLASPVYTLTSEGYFDCAEQGLVAQRRAVKAITASIEAEKGTCCVMDGPAVVLPEGGEKFERVETLAWMGEGPVYGDSLRGNHRRFEAMKGEMEEVDYGVDVLFVED